MQFTCHFSLGGLIGEYCSANLTESETSSVSQGREQPAQAEHDSWMTLTHLKPCQRLIEPLYYYYLFVQYLFTHIFDHHMDGTHTFTFKCVDLVKMTC